MPRSAGATGAESRLGPVVRLMSPSDLGERLKPFVFLDRFEADAPCSGISAPGARKRRAGRF